MHKRIIYMLAVLFLMIIGVTNVLASSITGTRYIKGTRYKLIDGKVDTEYSGVQNIKETDPEDGRDIDVFIKNGKTDSTLNGLQLASDGKLYLVKGIKVNKKSGLIEDEMGTYYVKKGIVESITGTRYIKGARYKLVDGKVDTEYSGVQNIKETDPEDGRDIDVFIKNGKTDSTLNGLQLASDGKLYLVKGIKVNKKSGLIEDEMGTYYIKKGIVESITGTRYIKGARYKLVDGKVDTEYSGVQNIKETDPEDGRDIDVFIKNGKTDSTLNGLQLASDGKVYLVKGIRVDKEKGVTFYRPVDSGYITDEHGPINGRMHYGLSIGAPYRSNVYSMANGVVTNIINRSSCGGNMIYIVHSINGIEYTAAYSHLAVINVSVGEMVNTNSVIGYVGGSSYESWDRCSTGAHLGLQIALGRYTTLTQFQQQNINPRSLINFPSKGVHFTDRITLY